MFLEILQISQQTPVLKSLFACSFIKERLKHRCSQRHLENVLTGTVSYYDTSWKGFENVLAKSLEDVLKTSWKRFEDFLKMSWQDIFKTSSRRLENVLKMSWRRMTKMNIMVLTKTSSRRRIRDLLKSYG